jgi:hypothetical protein
MPIPNDIEVDTPTIARMQLANNLTATAVEDTTLVSPVAPSSSPATNPRFVPFLRTLRERWLRRTIALALLIFTLAYQALPNYLVSFDDGYILPYAGAAKSMYLGDGWGSPKQVPPLAIWGLQTTNAGSIHLPNFGYPIGNGEYVLSLQENATSPFSYTISVGDQLIGTYPAQSSGYTFDVPIAASAFFAAGPDPTLYFRVLPNSATPIQGNAPTLIIFLLDMKAPSPFVLTIPPLLILLCAMLIILYCYLYIRKTNQAWQTAPKVILASLLLFVTILTIWMNLTQRIGILSNLLWIVLLFGLLLTIEWRRELANWLLHLRHPDDERFRLS